MAGTGEKKYAVRTKTSTAALQFDTGISRAKENLDQKPPGPPGWGLMQQSSLLLIDKKENC